MKPQITQTLTDAIHFYKVDDLDNVRRFYGELLGLPLYKDQGTCIIYAVGDHGKIGFCTHHPPKKNDATCITFVYASKEAVDEAHRFLKDRLNEIGAPVVNARFNIYHFFVKDFEGLTLEFQVFLPDGVKGL